MTTPDPRYGTIGIDEHGTFRIHFDRTLAHPVERVWQAIVDPARLETWMPGCVIEPRVGGAVRYDFGDEGAATGEVTVVEAPGTAGRLEHTWVWEGVDPSHVTWSLEPHGDGCRLTLVHAEVQRDPAVDFATGWHAILDVLDCHLDDRPADHVWEQMEETHAHYTTT